MREKGFQGMDTYSPYPLHGGSEALGLPPSKVPFIALCGAITGVITALAHADVDERRRLPLNVGGRPLLQPAGVGAHHLRAGGAVAPRFSIFFGLLGLSRLPQPYHPVFESDAFRSASTHGYWLSVPQATGVDVRTSEQAQVPGRRPR